MGTMRGPRGVGAIVYKLKLVHSSADMTWSSSVPATHNDTGNLMYSQTTIGCQLRATQLLG